MSISAASLPRRCSPATSVRANALRLSSTPPRRPLGVRLVEPRSRWRATRLPPRRSRLVPFVDNVPVRAAAFSGPPEPFTPATSRSLLSPRLAPRAIRTRDVLAMVVLQRDRRFGDRATSWSIPIDYSVRRLDRRCPPRTARRRGNDRAGNDRRLAELWPAGDAGAHPGLGERRFRPTGHSHGLDGAFGPKPLKGQPRPLRREAAAAVHLLPRAACLARESTDGSLLEP